MSINWDNVHSPFIDPMGFYTRHISVRKKKGGQGQPPPGPSGSGGPVSCSLTASSNQVAPGTQVTLTWNTTNAILADINGSNVALPSGSEQVTVSQNTTYTLTAHGVLGDTATASQTITVTSATRDPAAWPFSTNSPWNYPIGANATFATITAGVNSAGDVTTNGITRLYIKENNLVNIWVGQNSDTLWTITDTTNAWNGIYNSGSQTSNIPSGISGANGPNNSADNVTTVIPPTHLQAYDCEGASTSGTTLSVGAGGILHVDTEGPGWRSTNSATTGMGPLADNGTHNPSGSTSGSGMSVFAGAIRTGELANGINHMLSIITSGNIKNRNTPGGTGQVWPATSHDSNFNGSGSINSYGNFGNFYMGAIVALPSSVNVNTLGLATIQGLNVAIALQNFGACAVDTGEGGNLQFGIKMDFNILAAEFQNLANYASVVSDLNIIAPKLKVCTNSFHSNDGQPVTGKKIDGGDGTLPAPLAPPFGSTWGGGNGRDA